MAKIFLDSNILIDFLVEERGALNLAAVKLFENFSALSRTSNFKCLSLPNDGLLLVCEYAKSELKSGRKIDFEDVLQYFCALEGGCEAIVTNDKTFPKLQIALKRTDANLEDYAPKQKI